MQVNFLKGFGLNFILFSLVHFHILSQKFLFKKFLTVLILNVITLFKLRFTHMYRNIHIAICIWNAEQNTTQHYKFGLSHQQ